MTKNHMLVYYVKLSYPGVRMLCLEAIFILLLWRGVATTSEVSQSAQYVLAALCTTIQYIL